MRERGSAPATATAEVTERRRAWHALAGRGKKEEEGDDVAATLLPLLFQEGAGGSVGREQRRWSCEGTSHSGTSRTRRRERARPVPAPRPHRLDLDDGGREEENRKHGGGHQTMARVN